MVGNHLCLDFVNTEIIDNGERVDLLNGIEDFVRWALEAGLIASNEAERLGDKWKGRGSGAAFSEVIDFRTTVKEVVLSMSNGKKISPGAIQKINEKMRFRNGWNEVVKMNHAYQKRFRSDFREPVHLLAFIAESLAELITAAEPVIVRKCENPKCILYFYDTSKNSSRRWCSMKACGNRAKAASFYNRTRKTR